MTAIESALAGTGTRHVTRMSAALALAAGLATGILLTAPALVLGLSSKSDPASQSWADILEVAPFAARVWFFALVFAGAPGWWLLHRRGARGWLSAVLLGAILAALFLAAFSALASDFRDDQARAFVELLPIDLILTPIGAIVGFVIWIVAYRPTGRAAA